MGSLTHIASKQRASCCRRRLPCRAGCPSSAPGRLRRTGQQPQTPRCPPCSRSCTRSRAHTRRIAVGWVGMRAAWRGKMERIAARPPARSPPPPPPPCTVHWCSTGRPEDEEGTVHWVGQRARHHQLVLLRLHHREFQASIAVHEPLGIVSLNRCPTATHGLRRTRHFVCARQMLLPKGPTLLKDVADVLVLQHVVAVARGSGLRRQAAGSVGRQQRRWRQCRRQGRRMHTAVGVECICRAIHHIA